MKLSCINAQPNEEALLIIDKIILQYTKFQEPESKMYLNSVIELLTKLAEEDKEMLSMAKINLALTHLARSRYILRYLEGSHKLKKVDSLIDEAINVISRETIYLLNYPTEVEQ